MKKLGIILLALAFVVGATSLSLSEYKNTKLQEGASSEGSEVKSSSERSKLFDVCEKINDLYEAGGLEDQFLAKYPFNIRKPLLVDFGGDGIKEKIYFSRIGKHYGLLQSFEGFGNHMFHHLSEDDHVGSNIIHINNEFYILRLKKGGDRDYLVYEVGRVVEMSDVELKEKNIDVNVPAYKATTICKNGGNRLEVFSETAESNRVMSGNKDALNSDRKTNIIPASEESIVFETCEKINNLYSSSELEDMLLASYPKHLNESLLVDFDNDGIEEEMRYFKVLDYYELGQFFNKDRLLFTSYKLQDDLHNGSNIVKVNDVFLMLRFKGPEELGSFPYEVRKVTELKRQPVSGDGISVSTPGYKSKLLCKHDGIKLIPWVRK